MSTVPGRTVRVEILARKDCPSRGITIATVERVVRETGVNALVEIVDMTSEAQVQRRRFLGSPTVRVDGRDVEPESASRAGYTLACRVYRTGRGLAGWPDERWVRDALLHAAAQSSAAGEAASSSSSSATSP